MGIGYGGKSLSELLGERDSLLAETSHLWGLRQLALHEQDPAKVTRFNWRLTNACISARESAKLVAGSPTIRTFGECLFMLLLPEGDCVTASLGLIGHVACARIMVKSMVNLGFESNPGIKDGDIFACNDPYYGAPHPADHYALVPIFYKGELIAWASGMNHIMETGGITPGSMPVFSPYVFTDGFIYPPTKTGENFQIAKWWELMWEGRTRMPMMNILDDKARVTGALMIRSKVLEIVEEFGVDYFRQASRETLERERRRFVQTIQTQTVPGKYEQAEIDYYEGKGLGGLLYPEADRNWLKHEPADIRILPEGRVTLDAEGISRQDVWPHNSWEGPTRWGFCLWYLPQIVHSICVNTAPDYQVDVSAPKGSILSPTNRLLGSAYGLAVTGHYSHMLQAATSQSFFARGVLEEAFQMVYGGVHVDLGGQFENGVPWAFSDFTHWGGMSSGARPFRDGDTAATCGVNPQSDSGEVEEWEAYEPPVITLGKGIVVNGCGHGRYRGGMGYYILQLILNPGQISFGHESPVGADFGSVCNGVSGGYPGISGFAVLVEDTNMRELIAQGAGYPSNFPEIVQWIEEGKLKAGRIRVFGHNTAHVPMKDGDLLLIQSHHEAGWGDPVKRNPALVEKDLNETWITPDVASGVYGVVAVGHDGRWQTDQSATEQAREEMRQRRKAQAVPAQEWWRRERQKVLDKEFAEEIRGMYADYLGSGAARRRFTQFWQLPEDYGL